jgi:hypothetical protein
MRLTVGMSPLAAELPAAELAAAAELDAAAAAVDVAAAAGLLDPELDLLLLLHALSPAANISAAVPAVSARVSILGDTP